MPSVIIASVNEIPRDTAAYALALLFLPHEM